MQNETIKRLEGGRRARRGIREKPPLVSIVTVVFQDRKELEQILANLCEFDRNETELIVIDGGSKDGTLELLQQWDSEIDYWMSEQDFGIYDAMNKGINVATGTYLLHVNAGDRLLHLPIEKLKSASLEEVEIAAFRVFDEGKSEFLPSSGRWLTLRNTLHHQGTFYRRESFPVYDLQYKVLADFDVNQRLAQRGAKIKIFDDVVATHAPGGISHSKLADSEHFRIVYKNYGWVHLIGAWMLVKNPGNIVTIAHRIKKAFVRNIN